jgi:hypothetical protein
MYRKILSILENGGDLEVNRSSVGPKLKIPIMAEFMIITVDTGKAVCNTSKWQSITGLALNMTKEFQPGLSQGIYEALAWEGLIALLRGMH